MSLKESDFGGLFWDPFKQEWVQMVCKTFTQEEKEDLLTRLNLDEEEQDV